LLDLFCGAGGCSVGYHRAGFDVTGVDIKPQPRYPFHDVQQNDAMLILQDTEYCREFDVIHASPPCQFYSVATLLHGQDYRDYPDLVADVRDALHRIGRPYIIENVPGAPLHNPVMLCGSMFGLRIEGGELRRHRLFESNLPLSPPRPDSCGQLKAVTVAGHPGGSSTRDGEKHSTDQWAEVMGIRGMTGAELAEAIPPAYTEHLGRQILATLGYAYAEQAPTITLQPDSPYVLVLFTDKTEPPEVHVNRLTFAGAVTVLTDVADVLRVKS
jgi:DNA (cytosine-5)-methyltransferase 1